LKNGNAKVAQATATGFIRRKIGNTVYRVSVSFSGTSKERLEDKIMRLAENELNFGGFSGIMKIPQTGQLLEGASLL